MALSPLVFDPATGWLDTTVFPTYEGDETQVRKDLQRLFDQIKNYINGYTDGGGTYHDGLLDQVEQYIGSPELTVVNLSNVSSLPVRVPTSGTMLKITTDLELVRIELSQPQMLTSALTLTIGDGYLTLDGHLSGATDIKIVMNRVGNTISQ